MALEPLDQGEKGKGRAPLLVMVGFALVALFVVAALVKLYEREKPQVTLLSDISRFGVSKEISMSVVDEKRGVRSIHVVLAQDKNRKKLLDKTFSQQHLALRAGPNNVEESFTVNSKSLGFRDGVAELEVTVRDFSWWNWMEGNVVVFKYPVILDTRPPVVSILHSPHYIKSGSAGVVIYKISEPVEKHGVNINGYFHPGFPLPQKGDDIFGATIGIPHDMVKLEKVYVSATDQADNIARAPFGMILRQPRVLKDRINVSDGFLDLKVPEFSLYYPELTGSPLEKYLYVNKQIRNENYQRVREVCNKSQPERLWEGRFSRMARSSRRAGFADHRTYYYQDQKIDQQVHLGVDLASVRHAEAKAANHGVVVFADYLGIYGNTVILDHGQGIFSLYSHLSRIDVTVNDAVEKETVIGLTGKSGMAGGDHLHFSMLVNGIFVNPIEWWDEQWLELNILSFL